jgi:hypothetical protein
LRRTKGQIQNHFFFVKVKKIIRTTSLSSKAVDRVISLAHRADLARESEVGARGQRTTVGINVSDAELNGRMVLRGDEAV